MKTVFAIGMVMALYASQSCVAGTSNNRPETISGTIRIVGNEPFTQVIIRPASRSGANHRQDTLIIGPLAEELRSDFQGKAVTLEGNECTSPASRFSKCFRPTKIMID